MSKTVSYSRLSTYQECPELYRLKYIEKPKGYIAPLQEPFIKGTLAHTCIEEYLKGSDKEVAIQIALHNWLKNTCYLPVVESEIKSPKGIESVESVEIDVYDDELCDWSSVSPEGKARPKGGINIDDIYEYASQCGWLLHKCTASYKGDDKIRNKDGTLPKSPINYPPSEFKKQYNEKNLHILKGQIDVEACKHNISFKRMSLADIAATAVGYIYTFELPQEVSSVDEIELELDKEKVYFGPQKDIYWNGKIDTIYSTEDGAKIINDHKTEREKRPPENVCFDLQLNSYAAVVFEQTGKMADYIAITHLASNSLISSHTHPKVVNMCMDYLEEIQKDIERELETKGEEGPWMKKWPTKYGSPCLSRRDGSITNACPYIYKCWPDYASCIKEDLKDFLGY